MERVLCGIKDNVAQELFGPIIMVPNASVAVRTFQDGLFAQGSPMVSHPEDYQLHVLGTINTETGQITAEVQPFRNAPFVTGAAIVAAKENDNGNG